MSLEPCSRDQTKLVHETKHHTRNTQQAVFFHEVPHNIADFAILISHGFSLVGALQAQWASAVCVYERESVCVCVCMFVCPCVRATLGHYTFLTFKFTGRRPVGHAHRASIAEC